MTSERQRHAEALAHPTRLAVLELLEQQDEPLDVTTIAAAVGVHHTAVRSHLARLRDAGLVDERTADAAGRGRPKLLYSATGDVHDGADPGRDAYRELSSLLSTALRTARSTRDVGRDAGAALARTTRASRTHVAGPHVAETASRSERAIDVIQDEATALGFEPRRTTRRGQVDLVLQHCPFREVAAEDPGSICAMHLGIAEGIADTLGGLDVIGMVVNDPYRAGCRLQLRPTEVTT